MNCGQSESILTVPSSTTMIRRNSISYQLATRIANIPQPEQTTACIDVNYCQDSAYLWTKPTVWQNFLGVLRCWWTFLAQPKLNIYRVPVVKNELCDWLSRENLDAKISASSEELSRDAFQKMDVHLDRTMSKAELLSSLRKSDYLAALAALADEQDRVANEQDIPLYNQTEMERN